MKRNLAADDDSYSIESEDEEQSEFVSKVEMAPSTIMTNELI